MRTYMCVCLCVRVCVLSDRVSSRCYRVMTEWVEEGRGEHLMISGGGYYTVTIFHSYDPPPPVHSTVWIRRFSSLSHDAMSASAIGIIQVSRHTQHRVVLISC